VLAIFTAATPGAVAWLVLAPLVWVWLDLAAAPPFAACDGAEALEDLAVTGAAGAVEGVISIEDAAERYGAKDAREDGLLAVFCSTFH
jgi:hypothetical protein